MEILRCPATGARLRPATAHELAGTGYTVAYVTAEGDLLYPVVEGIPRLVPEAAVRLHPSNP